jgi:hypothetical protein
MGSRLEAVTQEVDDAAATAAFWSALLGREAVPEPGGALVPGTETQVGLRFVTSDRPQVGARRLHLHLTSSSLEDQQQTVEKALSLGGRHHDVGQLPEDQFVVLADPGDNELCVIEPQNRFLAGTGFLGEVSCDGTREVGLFWSEVLGWPLVWDEDEETAVQSPLGGTKVSWGGPPVEPRHGRNRQRFDLVSDNPRSEAERLVALGATVLTGHDDDQDDGQDGDLELADPDGNEFGLRALRAD